MNFFFPKPSETDLSDFESRITRNAPIGAQSWFRCGGAAELLFQPQDITDLSEFVKRWPRNKPFLVIGGLANTIVRDGGVSGATVQLGKPFSSVSVMGDQIHLLSGAGALNGSVAAAAMKAGIGGLEFLSGIPGTLGGAIAMNAGAYGSEIKDILIGITVINEHGHLKKFTHDELEFSYRHCFIPERSIVVEALLRGMKEDYETVKMRMNEIKKRRNETQPIREDTGGSTFANPSAQLLKQAGLPEGTRAWEIVDKVGGRGLKVGGAQMSEQHCNFMINTGNATASDLENLGDELIRRTQDQFGENLLRWEIKRIGQHLT